MSEEEQEAVDQLKKLLKDFDNEDISEIDLFLINKLIEKQQKEIEEKSTIIMAGAEKVKQLEKEIEKLNFENHMVKKWNEQLDQNCISKDKIRGMLNYLDNTSLNNYEIVIAFRKMMKELLEDDGDHIPRID